MNIKNMLLVFSITISSLFTSCSADDNILLLEDEITEIELTAKTEPSEGAGDEEELEPNE